MSIINPDLFIQSDVIDKFLDKSYNIISKHMNLSEKYK